MKVLEERLDLLIEDEWNDESENELHLKVLAALGSSRVKAEWVCQHCPLSKLYEDRVL